jgi:NhaC family Na+:H+ antiporter
MSGVFGVPTFSVANVWGTYFPYYFFAFLSPAILFGMALTGWGITGRDHAESGPAVSADD